MEHSDLTEKEQINEERILTGPIQIREHLAKRGLFLGKKLYLVFCRDFGLPVVKPSSHLCFSTDKKLDKWIEECFKNKLPEEIINSRKNVLVGEIKKKKKKKRKTDKRKIKNDEEEFIRKEITDARKWKSDSVKELLIRNTQELCSRGFLASRAVHVVLSICKAMYREIKKENSVYLAKKKKIEKFKSFKGW